MSPSQPQRLGPEFSRPFSLETLSEDGAVERIEASETERSAVARRLSLLSLNRLTAVLRIGRAAGQGTVSVAGRFEAEVTQTCVVSLQPLQRRLREDFSALFSPTPADGGETEPVVVDAAAEDPPEPLGADGLDLGEAVVQQLAIALNPYPRGDDATLDSLEWAGKDDDEAARASPFEGLKALSRGQ